MSTPEFAGCPRSSSAAFISANSGADPSLASSEFLTDAMKLLQNKDTVFRFDASDLMPATVGAGSFWKGMVNWIDGRPTDQVLSDIQAGYQDWPQGRESAGWAAARRGDPIHTDRATRSASPKTCSEVQRSRLTPVPSSPRRAP